MNVSVPVHGPRGDLGVDLLIGPSSEIVLSDSEETHQLDERKVEEIAAALRARIERATGRSADAIANSELDDPLDAFVDFRSYDKERSEDDPSQS